RKREKMKKLFLSLSLLLAACEHIPGGSKIGIELEIGSGKPPTFEQAEAWRRQNVSDSDRVLINGTPVDRNKFPGIVRIATPGGACTASVVGPRTILTAAHCGEQGQTASFTTVT